MLPLELLALLFAANPVYGRPAADDTNQLVTAPIPCTVADVSIEPFVGNSRSYSIAIESLRPKVGARIYRNL